MCPVPVIAPPRLRVAAIPSHHPYVHAISDPAFVELLPDPVPPGAPAGQWWPPQMLDAGWLSENAERFEVLHLHFGAESYSPAHVAAAVAAARRLGRPLVYTVHDLQNPQLTDQTEHERILDVVIPAATALVTLTPGAAAEITARWGREVEVIPHPPLLPTGAAPAGLPRARTTVGMHLRDLRPNIDAVGAVGTLARALAVTRDRGDDVTGIVYLNERVRDDATAAAVAGIVAATPALALERRPRASDPQLWAEIAGLDVCVLPYGHGTHSGWVELCHDLGVPIAGTAVGYIGQQHPQSYTSFAIGDPASLATAIQVATTTGTRPGSDDRAFLIAERRWERRSDLADIRRRHTALYARVTAAGGAR